MRFTYYYKSADGIRHEAKIDASSREEAFFALRQRGIRPIKVIANCGTKANGEVRFIVGKRLAVACIAIGLMAGGFSVLTIGHIEIDTRSERIKALDGSAQEILADHGQRMKTAGVSVLDEPWKLAISDDDKKVDRIISSAYTELNVTRTKLRELFRIIYEKLPGQKEREDANCLYTAAVDALDLEEAGLARSKKAYDFLKSNKADWKIEAGKIVFTNLETEDSFSEFRREL